MIFSGRSGSGYPKIFMYFIQMIALVVNPLQTWLINFVDIFSVGIASTATDICVTPVDYYGKVAIRVKIYNYKSNSKASFAFCICNLSWNFLYSSPFILDN